MSRLITSFVDAALRVPLPLRWLALVAWAAMIFLASSQQGLAVSDDPGVDRPLRQVAHVGVYGVLALLLTWSLSGGRYPSPWMAIVGGVLALLYGVSDEWHQTLVPTRTGRVEDLIWDGIGAAIAVAMVVLVGAVIRRGVSPEAGTEPGPAAGP